MIDQTIWRGNLVVEAARSAVAANITPRIPERVTTRRRPWSRGSGSRTCFAAPPYERRHGVAAYLAAGPHVTLMWVAIKTGTLYRTSRDSPS